jgi:hypothetical protein
MPFAGKVSKQAGKEHEALIQGMKNLRELGIPLFATGVSIYLAGWVLERTALLKTDAIMASMRRRHAKMHKTKGADSPHRPPETAVVPPRATSVRPPLTTPLPRMSTSITL